MVGVAVPVHVTIDKYPTCLDKLINIDFHQVQQSTKIWLCPNSKLLLDIAID